MHADVQNLFIRIQMLSYAQQNDLTVREIQPVLEERGYRLGEREVKQELENLTQENFLTPRMMICSALPAQGSMNYRKFSRCWAYCTRTL